MAAGERAHRAPLPGLLVLVALAALPAQPIPAAQGKRPVAVDDLFKVFDVRDPQRSPDGKWVAYTVMRAVRETDKNDTDVWMVSWDGRERMPLTSTRDSESHPRWSPDGKYLAFLSSRPDAKTAQIWLLPRAGGEAVKLTDVKGGVSDYAWSPNGRRLVLAVNDPDPTVQDPADPPKEGPARTPKPIVLDRYYFKSDSGGYLRGERTHLYLFDVAAKKAEILTPGAFNETAPAWSPDGARVAFIRRHGEGDVDKAPNADLFVVDARSGATPRRLTTTTVEESGRVSFSPDGRWIAYQVGDELKYFAYRQSKLAIVPSQGGPAHVLTEALDRSVNGAVWTADSSSLLFTAIDDRTQYLARVPVAGGRIDRLTAGPRVVNSLSPSSDQGFAVLASTSSTLPEVFAFEAGRLRKLTGHNDDWLDGVILGATEDVTSISKDGTEVHGVLVKPPTFTRGRRYPALLRIHGGPNSQDEHSLNFERELFAAHGYVVLAVNYRGSSGRGREYQRAIFADWGNREVVDLLGAMDHVERLGIVDPDRLGIGGWSYGGILTNCTIATDARFKAATSGAASSNQISMYGTDQYVQQYDNEIGPPWKSQDLWVKLSYPFFHADRIRTPTLFLGGEKDFNVPLVGSEQMYQALRSLGVPTELVIYPDQRHAILTPSYRADRLERYLNWYAKYLKPGETVEARR
ncbi:MAG TPA: S9 family peptidase [Vicinamibacterales bacterium]|nr:S9 family peptidase [Vicinamibacterales bacterium]